MLGHPERAPAPRRPGAELPKLLAASAVSNLGDGIALRAAPLLATALTRDPAVIAGLAFAQRLPWLLFPLVSGALADRLDRRRAMATVAVFRALLIGGLGVAVLLDLVSVPLLFVVFFLLATAETLFDIAAAAVLPSVVPRDDLPRANARLAGLLTVTNQFVGPPLGGFLFGVAAALPFLLGAGGLVTAAALILLLRGTFGVPRAADAPPPDLRGEIAEGLRWLWGHRLLRTLSLALGILNLTLVAQTAIMVLYAQERLGLGPTGFGILVATYGVGGILGSPVAHRVVGWLGASRTLRLAVVIETVVPAALALTSDAVLAGAVLTFFGFHAIVWGAILVSLRQELTPSRLRGRVQSAHRLLEEGSAAPGALLGGLLAAGLGLTAPFWFGAVVGALLLPLVWPVFSNATVAEARRRAAHEADREAARDACDAPEADDRRA